MLLTPSVVVYRFKLIDLNRFKPKIVFLTVQKRFLVHLLDGCLDFYYNLL